MSFVAISVDMEHLFSHGQLLSHICSCLSSQSTCTLLCLGAWSHLNLIKTEDVLKVTTLPDIQDDAEEELKDG
jgi:hypothetical protein